MYQKKYVIVCIINNLQIVPKTVQAIAFVVITYLAAPHMWFAYSQLTSEL